MAKKGQKKAQKRISAQKTVSIERKKKVWTFAFRPGTHAKKESLTLGTALRDVLKVAKNSKEARFILNSEKVKVDGKIRKDTSFGIGLFDVVELVDSKKFYRVLIDRKGRIALKEEKKEKSSVKLCKIKGKKAVKGKKVLVHTEDGRNIVQEKSSLNIGDSIELQVPEQNILNSLELKKGSLCLLTGGRRVGETAVVKEIVPGTMRKEKLLSLEGRDGKEFQTSGKNVFVVGKEKPLFDVVL